MVAFWRRLKEFFLPLRSNKNKSSSVHFMPPTIAFLNNNEIEQMQTAEMNIKEMNIKERKLDELKL